MINIAVSPADDAAIDELLAIEREAFSRPWTHGQLLREIYGDDSYFAVARNAETGAEILGYAILRRLCGEAELINIAARADSRRRGVGSALLAAAIKNARENGAEQIFLEARASNFAAIALYAKHGFRKVGRRRGYYDSPDEDAVIMKKELS